MHPTNKAQASSIQATNSHIGPGTANAHLTDHSLTESAATNTLLAATTASTISTGEGTPADIPSQVDQANMSTSPPSAKQALAATHPSPLDETASSTFLDKLPAELRNEIYRLVLVAEDEIEVLPQNIHNRTALLKTCQQTRQEALMLFYASNTFSTTYTYLNGSKVTLWLKAIGRDAAKLICSLRCRVQSCATLRARGISLQESWRDRTTYVHQRDALIQETMDASSLFVDTLVALGVQPKKIAVLEPSGKSDSIMETSVLALVARRLTWEVSRHLLRPSFLVVRGSDVV